MGKYMKLILILILGLLSLISNCSNAKRIEVKPKYVAAVPLTDDQRKVLSGVDPDRYKALYRIILKKFKVVDRFSLCFKCSENQHEDSDAIIKTWISDIAPDLNSNGLCLCNIFSATNDREINWDVFIRSNSDGDVYEKQKAEKAINIIVNNLNYYLTSNDLELRKELVKIMNSCLDSKHLVFSSILNNIKRKKLKPGHCLCRFICTPSSKKGSMASIDLDQITLDQNNSSCCSGCNVM
jgi:hypothetical protein